MTVKGTTWKYVRGLSFSNFKQLLFRAPKWSPSVIRKEELLIKHLFYYVLLIYNAFIFSVSFEHSLNSINSPCFSIWYNSTTWKQLLIYMAPSLHYILAFQLISSSFSFPQWISGPWVKECFSLPSFELLTHYHDWWMVYLWCLFWYLANLNWANK